MEGDDLHDRVYAPHAGRGRVECVSDLPLWLGQVVASSAATKIDELVAAVRRFAQTR
jgi:hypothetical protein